MGIYLSALSGYILIINLFSFLSMRSDKKRAATGRSRIPEARLFLLALMGGSIGAIMGMNIFRHKTRHLSFRIGMPLILLLQLAVVILLLLI